MPSSDVGNDGNVLSTLLLLIPFSNGVYFFGSNVSVCAIPPAIQSNITVSAVVEGFFPVVLIIRANGAFALNAASVAALVFFKNSRRFQFAFILTIFLQNNSSQQV